MLKFLQIFRNKEEFSKLLSKKNIDHVLNELLDLDGIGETQTDSIKSFFSKDKNKRICEDLMNRLIIKEYSVKSKKGKFTNKKIMFTGGFQEMSRSEAKSIAENHGGKVLGSVSKN